MVEVVYLSERKPIPPKSVSAMHMQQNFVCTFDPNAPVHERWLWQVNFTRMYKFYGSAPSLARAQRQARARIDKLIGIEQRAEEAE
jgi:hypothetical protein